MNKVELFQHNYYKHGELFQWKNHQNPPQEIFPKMFFTCFAMPLWHYYPLPQSLKGRYARVKSEVPVYLFLFQPYFSRQNIGCNNVFRIHYMNCILYIKHCQILLINIVIVRIDKLFSSHTLLQIIYSYYITNNTIECFWKFSNITHRL